MNDATATETFDYVIVGGGSAGCVLAHRLTEDPNTTVCLLEAGPRDRHPFIHIPAALMQLMFNPRLNWKFSSAPQDRLNGRQVYLPRGKTLGGSSSINGMAYVRGHPKDYDEWAGAGNTGWGWQDVFPYFLKSEHNEIYTDDPHHAQGGPLNVTNLRSPSPMDAVLFDAAEELQFKRRADFNGEDQEGFGIYQVTQKNGRRYSTAKAFLEPARTRPNLQVVTGAFAEKIDLANGRAAGIRARVKGEQKNYKVRRELILSAGAFISPKILMLSGIGDAAELKGVGIESTHHLPGVGRNLQDHAAIQLYYNTRNPKAYGLTLDAIPHLAATVVQYAFTRTGLLSSNLVEAGGFIKTEPGLERCDIQYVFLPAYRPSPTKWIGYGRGYVLSTVLLRPKSRGAVTLKTMDPAVPPHIDPRFFEDERDLDVLTRGLIVGRRILNAPAFHHMGASEHYPGPDIDGHDALKQYVLKYSSTIFHPVGTCKMGHDGAAVVDDRLRVRGLEGLRVVDASIMPTVVGGNTNAPTIMIAEKASDLIKKDARSLAAAA